MSAKDLIQNHLTMCLYQHTEIWKDRPELWPKGIYCNGHIMVGMCVCICVIIVSSYTYKYVYTCVYCLFTIGIVYVINSVYILTTNYIDMYIHH